MTKEELEALIRDYQYYRSLAGSLGGNNHSHSQYEHLQSVIKMCDEKLLQLNTELKEITCQDQSENPTS